MAKPKQQPPLKKRDESAVPRPMGTPRELLNMFNGETYRYRVAMKDQLERIEWIKAQWKAIKKDDEWVRIMKEDMPEKWRCTTEVEFFFVTVRGILRMAEAMKTLAKENFPTISDRLVKANNDFDRDAPQAKEVRDLLTHREAYMLGSGKKDLPNPEMGAWLVTPEEDTGLVFGGVVISVGKTASAAEKLANALADAVRQIEAEERAGTTSTA